MKKLSALRKSIDATDSQLLRLLAKRNKLSRKVGLFKLSTNLPLLQKSRWKSVLDNRRALGRSLGMRPEFITKIFTLIHKESLWIQKRTARIKK